MDATKFKTPCKKFYCLNWEPGSLVRDVIGPEDSNHWIKLWYKCEEPGNLNKKILLGVPSVAYGDPSDLEFTIRFENKQYFEGNGNPFAWRRMNAFNKRESKFLTCVLAKIRNDGCLLNEEWNLELTLPDGVGVTRSLQVKVTDELDYNDAAPGCDQSTVRISQSRGDKGIPYDTTWYLPQTHIMEFVEAMYEAGRCVHTMECKQMEDFETFLRLQELPPPEPMDIDQ